MSQEGDVYSADHADEKLDDLVKKISRTKKYKPGSFRRRYLIFLYCVLMYIPLMTAGVLSLGLAVGWKDYQPNPVMGMIGMLLVFLGVAGILTASIFYSTIIYRAWKQVAPFGGVPASVAVLLIYVPVVNYFWIWVAAYQLSRLQLRMHEVCLMPGRKARPWISLVWCLLTIGQIAAVAVVVIDPGFRDPSRYAFNTFIGLFVLWWPYVLHDNKEAAEAIAQWRVELDDSLT